MRKDPDWVLFMYLDRNPSSTNHHTNWHCELLWSQAKGTVTGIILNRYEQLNKVSITSVSSSGQRKGKTPCDWLQQLQAIKRDLV